MEVEGDAFKYSLATELGHRENNIVSGAGSPRLEFVNLPPDHVGDCSLGRRFIPLARRYQPSVAKDSDLVGDLEHLFHAMADEEDGDALPFQVTDKFEQLLDLMGESDAVGSSMIRMRTLREMAFAISTDCWAANVESSRRISHVQRDAEFGQDAFGVSEHLPPVDHHPAILVTDENVLGDVEIGKQQSS